jgi:hypothetical protein
VTSAIDARSARPDLASGPVVPGLEDSIRRGERITITSADASYRVERIQRGATPAWVMRDRGDFPVLAGRLNQLTEGLQGLRYVRRMTSDPTKHDRLGVTDPREGGRGILVQIESGDRALLVDLILGVEPSGGLYVRRPGQDQVWAARGELPPLRDVATWLELQPLSLPATSIQMVEITPPEGRAYTIAREAPDAVFHIVAPSRMEAVAQSSIDDVAQRITALSPIDVAEAPSIQGEPRARVRVTTFTGIAIEAELIDSGGKTWLKLVARASTPEQEPAARAINDPAAGWAYALSEIDMGTLTAPLNTLIPGAVQ